MRKITRNMLKIYKPLSELDWMNYRIVKESELTYHHIIKKCDGGKNIISNGAILLPIAHQYLHLIESVDINRYERLNKIFKDINNSSKEPTRDMRILIEYLLSEFEYRNIDKVMNNGKRLIKCEFKDRGFY